jgi:hypothetical protein
LQIELNTTHQPRRTLYQSYGGISEGPAICLGSLDDAALEVIELTTCGHRYHLECLQEQLEQALRKPNPGQRLVLTGCRCAKCGSVCGDHPKLQPSLSQRSRELHNKVNAVLKDYLNIKDNDNNDENTEQVLEEARRNYAIYVCSDCGEPYFGGTIACADTIDGEVPSEERLCVACDPTRVTQSITTCRHPVEHRGYWIWKCRYCCQVATHVCYGTVHFCQDCHDRNSQRVAHLQQEQRMRRTRGTLSQNQPPACLTAIPCPGGDACPFPKPPGSEDRHQNGSGSNCEQVYGCAWCQSNPNTGADRHGFVEPPGSRNFLKNGSGQEGGRHWQSLNRGQCRWRVEQSDTPLNETITTNFVSSFQWCVMAQTVDLSLYLRPQHELDDQRRNIGLEASAKYMGRTDCPSVFYMELILSDVQRRPILRQRTQQLAAPADFWERASVVMDVIPPRARYAHVVVHGKDLRFWQGNFGSKMTDCQLRVIVVGEAAAEATSRREEILEQYLYPAALVEPPQENDGNNQGGGGIQERAAAGEINSSANHSNT